MLDILIRGFVFKWWIVVPFLVELALRCKLVDLVSSMSVFCFDQYLCSFLKRLIFLELIPLWMQFLHRFQEGEVQFQLQWHPSVKLSQFLEKKSIDWFLVGKRGRSTGLAWKEGGVWGRSTQWFLSADSAYRTAMMNIESLHLLLMSGKLVTNCSLSLFHEEQSWPFAHPS